MAKTMAQGEGLTARQKQFLAVVLQEPYILKKGLIWKGLTIDSLYDIAVNKLQTISQRPREKDYVDLYLIMKKTGWSFSQLRQDAQIKFGIHVESVYLASCLLRINEFSNWPKMLVALNRQEMKNFYVKLAGELKQEVFT